MEETAEIVERSQALNTADNGGGEPFDVFLWANEIDEVKNNVSAELFLFNKNYTPYKIK